MQDSLAPILLKSFINLINKPENNSRIQTLCGRVFPESNSEDPVRTLYLNFLNKCLSDSNLAISTVPILGRLFDFVTKRVSEASYGMNDLIACMNNINHLVNGDHRDFIAECVVNYLEGTIERRVKHEKTKHIQRAHQLIHGWYSAFSIFNSIPILNF